MDHTILQYAKESWGVMGLVEGCEIRDIRVRVIDVHKVDPDGRGQPCVIPGVKRHSWCFYVAEYHDVVVVKLRICITKLHRQEKIKRKNTIRPVRDRKSIRISISGLCDHLYRCGLDPCRRARDGDGHRLSLSVYALSHPEAGVGLPRYSHPVIKPGTTALACDHSERVILSAASFTCEEYPARVTTQSGKESSSAGQEAVPKPGMVCLPLC